MTTKTSNPSKTASVPVTKRGATPGRGKRQASAGVVDSLVYGISEPGVSSVVETSRLVEALRLGLPVRELEDLRESLGVSMDKLIGMLGISKSSLHRRRKADQRLATDQSDRVVRYARLMSLAVEVLETAEQARQWLSIPQVGLGGAVPLEFAETEVGAREVEDLLGRIEYSVYS